MSLYVAAYDVRSNRVRDRIAKVLAEFGQRVQWSVFLIWLAPEDVPDLRRRVGRQLSKHDRFDLFPLDDHPTRPR